MRIPKLRIDMAVAILCSLVLCLSTTRVMMDADWTTDPGNSTRKSSHTVVVDTIDSEGFRRVSAIDISTPMVVVNAT